MLYSMRTKCRSPWGAAVIVMAASGWLVGGLGLADDAASDRRAIEQSVRRAADYLAREVAGWKAEHDCYSCHNHGDGARTLFALKNRRFDVPPEPIDIAGEWLRQPERWDDNGPDGPFSDRTLARIQFAAALAEATGGGAVTDRRPLRVAAEHLTRDQLASGAWELAGADALGGPTTYGRALATVLSRRVLVVADPDQFADSIRRCDSWLRGREPRSVVDAAAVLWGLQGATDDAAVALRRRCRELLARGQGESGGWGPYVTAGPEAFDTALAVWALSSESDATARAAVARGRSFLVRLQLSDGSWPETTRPLPRESYSQRISTTAWATLALLEDRSGERPPRP